MDNPGRHLIEFIRGYWYGGDVDDDTLKENAQDCIEYMRERGWAFESIPAEAR